MFRAFLFENGVKAKVGGCIGTVCKSLKTVQAKQCSPQKTGFSKKKSTILPTKYSASLVEITGPIPITVTLLQSMHGALPAELGPHSFGSNKKSTTHFCVVLFSGGDYRADSDHGDPLAVHARRSPG